MKDTANRLRRFWLNLRYGGTWRGIAKTGGFMLAVALFIGAFWAIPGILSSPQVEPIPIPSPSPEDPPLVRGLDTESIIGLLSDSTDQRIQVRGAVKDYLARSHPEWIIEGISLNHVGETSSMYYVAVDITEKGQTRIIQLKAWYFVKDSGESYWKAGEP